MPACRKKKKKKKKKERNKDNAPRSPPRLLASSVPAQNLHEDLNTEINKGVLAIYTSQLSIAENFCNAQVL